MSIDKDKEHSEQLKTTEQKWTFIYKSEKSLNIKQIRKENEL